MRGANKAGIDGNEINKRRCLSEENLLVVSTSSFQATGEHDFKKKIKSLLVETCVAFKHMVSEVTLVQIANAFM